MTSVRKTMTVAMVAVLNPMASAVKGIEIVPIEAAKAMTRAMEAEVYTTLSAMEAMQMEAMTEDTEAVMNISLTDTLIVFVATLEVVDIADAGLQLHIIVTKYDLLAIPYCHKSKRQF